MDINSESIIPSKDLMENLSQTSSHGRASDENVMVHMIKIWVKGLKFKQCLKQEKKIDLLLL